MGKHKQFIGTTAGVCAAALVAAVLFNLATDPYDIYQTPQVNGFNARKTAPFKKQRLSTAYKVRRFRPRSLVLGASRALLSLDCGHPGWPEDARPCYNLAAFGNNVYESARHFQHASAVGPVRLVVFGLDFFSFNIDQENHADFAEGRLAEDRWGGKSPPYIKDYAATLLSWDAVWDSIETVRRQDDPSAEILLPNGQPEADFDEKRSAGRDEAGLFRQIALEVIRNGYTPPPRRRFRLRDPETGAAPGLDSLRLTVKSAREKNVDLRLFVSPVHAYIEEAKWRMGLWPVYEEWKRDVAAIAEGAGGEKAVPLWDCSGFNAITEIPPPLKTGDPASAWFRDPSHYNRETGNLILNSALEFHPDGKAGSPDFCVRIDVSTIERHLESIRRSRKDYAKRRPADVERVHRWVDENRLYWSQDLQ